VPFYRKVEIAVERGKERKRPLARRNEERTRKMRRQKHMTLQAAIIRITTRVFFEYRSCIDGPQPFSSEFKVRWAFHVIRKRMIMYRYDGMHRSIGNVSPPEVVKVT